MNPKTEKFIKRYPFVSGILLARMEPYDGRNGTNVDNLTIRVEKADGDLMYRRASNVGLGDSLCIFQFKEARKNQVMRRGEYLFAIGKEGKIINRVNWSRNDEEQGKEVYGYSAFFAEQSTFSNGDLCLANPIWDKVKYLAWVTVEAWYIDTKDDDAPDGRIGNFCDRSIHITIYCEPEEGFEKLYEESSVYTNLVLDSRIMTRGFIDKNHDIVIISGMLYEMCIIFQEEVYFNGMKKILDDSEFRGASGQFGSVKVLCAEMCGYDRVTLEDAVSYVTFQLRPSSKYMYVLGQQGTLPQIRNLVRTVVRMWNQDSESRNKFKSDQEVSVM